MGLATFLTLILLSFTTCIHPISALAPSSDPSVQSTGSFAAAAPSASPTPSLQPPIPPPRFCGPQKDALENAMNLEDVQLALLSRASKELGEARKARDEAQENFNMIKECLVALEQDLRDLNSAIRAKRVLLRQPGGNTPAMRAMLRNLIRERRRVTRMVRRKRKRLNNASNALRNAQNNVDEKSGQVATIERTLETVREAVNAARWEYLECKNS